MAISRPWGLSAALIILCTITTTTRAAGRSLQQTPSPTDASTAPVGVCIPTEQFDAAECAATFVAASTPMTFTCYPAKNIQGCINMLESGTAQLAKLPASGAVLAEKRGFRPFVAEFFSEVLGNATEGYSVALVNSAWCAEESKRGFGDLRGLDACFSGYRTDGGWQVPMGSLVREGGMQAVSKSTSYSDDAETSLDFFKDICAPGIFADAPNVNKGTKYTKMCDLCKSVSSGSCAAGDTWYGAGVTKCDADVIFTTYPIIDETAGPLNPSPSSSTPTVTPTVTPTTSIPPPTPTVAPVPPATPTVDDYDESSAPPTRMPPPTPTSTSGSGATDYSEETDTPPSSSDNNNNNDDDDAAADDIPKATAKPPPSAPRRPPPAKAPSGKNTNDNNNNNNSDNRDDDEEEEDATPTPTTPAAGGDATAEEDVLAGLGRRKLAQSGNSDADSADLITTPPTTVPTSSAATPTTPVVDLSTEDLAGRVLLCPNMGNPCQPLENYKECNLARVPSQVFIASSKFAESDAGKAAKDALVAAGNNAAFLTQAAKVGATPYTLVTPGTTALRGVEGTYFDDRFKRAIESLNVFVRGDEVAAANAAAGKKGDADEGDGGGSGLSTAAIVGISAAAIAVVGGAVVGGIVYFQKRKDHTGWKRYQDAVKEIQRI